MINFIITQDNIQFMTLMFIYRFTVIYNIIVFLREGKRHAV